MKPVIVGLRNPYKDVDALSPLRGAGRSLWRMSGMTEAEYLSAFERVNVEERDRRNILPRSIMDLRGRLMERDVIVLGREAWRALLLPGDAEWFSSLHEETTRSTFSLLPHPSGRCRLYNDSKNKERTRTCLREAAARYFKTSVRSTRSSACRATP